jgi:hypothetical protein
MIAMISSGHHWPFIVVTPAKTKNQRCCLFVSLDPSLHKEGGEQVSGAVIGSCDNRHC